MQPTFFKYIAALTLFLSVLVTGCQQQPVSDYSPSDGPAQNSERIDLFAGKTNKPWKIFALDHEQTKLLHRNSVFLSSSDVNLRYIKRNSRNDALKLSWNDDWRAGLLIKSNEPVDLQRYLATGAISFDINVLELAKGGVSFKINCGSECERKLPFTEQAALLADKGWQNIRVALSCFVQEGDDFSAITEPFIMETGGTGQVAIANIRFLNDAPGNVKCPDYKTVAVTASMLKEYWARDWWEPRHQQKLERVKQGNVDLLMIGDSITQGWENEGKNIWEEFYAERNAVNLGYGGDRTENVLWRLQHGEVDGINPKVAVLMIGTNNTGHRLEKPEYTATGIKTLLAELKTRLPDTKILLLGIFPREEQPAAQRRKINDSINDIIAGYADNEQIFFLNINQHFLNEDNTLSRDIMPDLLHLNETGYQIWANAMEPTLKRLWGE